MKRPESLDAGAADAWVDYVYLRDNPAGLHKEHWHHSAGCHSWLVVTRNMRTHEIVAVEFAEKEASEVTAPRAAEPARATAA